MPLITPRSHLLATTPRYLCRSSFHTSTPVSSSSPLFHLAALSNARESRHFKNVSKLSQVEHSPNLQLIRSSEVEPFNGVRDIENEKDKAERDTARLTSERTSRAWLRSGDSVKKVEVVAQTAPSVQATSTLPTAKAGLAGGISEAAAQEIGRVAGELFRTRAREVEAATTRVMEEPQTAPEPWKQFGITEAEYLALQTLEEGGAGRSPASRNKHNTLARRPRLTNTGELAEDVDPPDEPLWGPSSSSRYPLGSSDAEYMANIMQFKERVETEDEARRQAQQPATVNTTDVTGTRYVQRPIKPWADRNRIVMGLESDGANPSSKTKVDLGPSQSSRFKTPFYVLLTAFATGLAVWNLKPTVTITSSSSPDWTNTQGSASSPSAAKIATDEAMLMTYIQQLEHLERSKDKLLKSRESHETSAAQPAELTTPTTMAPVSSDPAQNLVEEQEVTPSMPAKLEALAQKAQEEVSSLRAEVAGMQMGYERKGWSHWFWDSG